MLLSSVKYATSTEIHCTSCVFSLFLYALVMADLLQTFHQSLAVVEPTPADRNGVAEHGTDDSYGSIFEISNYLQCIELRQENGEQLLKQRRYSAEVAYT